MCIDGVEMVDKFEACFECKRKCFMCHAKKKNSNPHVSSFFKIMIGDEFSNVLLLPPKFAPTVASLVGQDVFLEDSNGLIWKAELTSLEGSFTFRHGWDAFVSDHGLETGDFLTFHFIPGSHFMVQIYGRSGCEKLEFSKERVAMGRDKAEKNTIAKGGSSLTTERNSIDKEKPSSPNLSALNIETSQFEEDINDDSNSIEKPQVVSKENFEKPCYKKINREVVGSEEDLSSLQKLIKNLEAVDGSEKILGGQKSFNGVAKSLKSESEASLRYKGSRCKDLSPASASSLLPKEMAQPDRKLEKIQVEQDDLIKQMEIIEIEHEDGISNLPKICHNKVDRVKRRRSVSGQPTAVGISCLIPANNQSFLELPEALPAFTFSKRRTVKERRCILLRDPAMRLWPVLYQQTSQFSVLTAGWEAFSKVNNIQLGDACTFEVECANEGIFRVRITRSNMLCHRPWNCH